MTIDNIKKELRDLGQNPDDFNINITENGYSVTPKWFYETKQVAKQEDKPIKEDVDIVAETAVFAMMDIQDLAEMLVYALNEIETLKGMVNHG